ncbi:hypothetical protein QAD02_009891, partial [Eretmocerus hayati]
IMERPYTEAEHERIINFENLEEADQYWYKTIRSYLTILGSWSFQPMWKRVPIFIVLNIPVFLYTLSGGILNPIMHWEDGIDIMMSNFLLCALTASFFGQYLILFFVAGKFPPLLETLAEVSRSIIDPAERKILSEYAQTARKMNSILLISFMICPTSSFFNPLMSKVGDKLNPLPNNETREYILVPMEFIFFKQEDHYLFSSWLATSSGTSNCLAGAFICCMYILVIKQICALFKITSSRLRKIVVYGDDVESPPINSFEQNRQYMKEAVEVHTQAIRMVEQLEDTYTLIVMAFQFTSVAFLSLSYFYVAKVRGVPLVRHYTEVSLIIGFNAMLLCFNALGQEVIDVSDDIFDTAYETEWYSLRPTDRKYISILLHRSLHPSQLTAGGFSVLSYETFGA